MTTDPQPLLKPPASDGLLDFRCRCGQKMKVRRRQLGRTGPCPNCHRDVTPTEENTTSLGGGIPTPAPGPSWAPTPAPYPARSAAPAREVARLRALREERDRLCAELGALAYEERVLLPRNRGISDAVRAITDCDARIAELEARFTDSARRST
jgi:hypothetical protein